MTKETVSALMLAPGMRPCRVELYTDREFLCGAVSLGLDEQAEQVNCHRLGSNTAILYCHAAPLQNGKPNRRVNGKMFWGVFYIVGWKAGRPWNLSASASEILTRQLEHWLPSSPVDDFDFLLDHWEDVLADAECL